MIGLRDLKKAEQLGLARQLAYEIERCKEKYEAAECLELLQFCDWYSDLKKRKTYLESIGDGDAELDDKIEEKHEVFLPAIREVVERKAQDYVVAFPHRCNWCSQESLSSIKSSEMEAHSDPKALL
ncbi:unnamed protein product [Peronospora belbahrii]|uniref:Uncharacterized protein n=1 Tax=Peronospora belbahrii TaxID=622444 RepID=A0ABN8CT36_9STRA|nr:unnamed protein product [Peronospora belbahrii]